MSASELVGFAGVGLAGAAYVPQLVHLVREHCSAGVSRAAFATWLVSSLLVTARAITVGEMVFVALGVVQIAAIVAVVGLSTRYVGEVCASHVLGRGAR